MGEGTSERADENIPLTQEKQWEEDLLGNHNMNKKHHSEGAQVLKEKFSKNKLKSSSESYLKALA